MLPATETSAPRTAPHHATQSPPVHCAMRPRASIMCSCRWSRPASSASSADATASGASPARSRAIPADAYIGLISACVASAATPPSTWIASAPTAKKRVATAAPSAPVAGHAPEWTRSCRDPRRSANSPQAGYARRNAAPRADRDRPRPAGRRPCPCRGAAPVRHAPGARRTADPDRPGARDALYRHAARADPRRLHVRAGAYRPRAARRECRRPTDPDRGDRDRPGGTPRHRDRAT